MKSETFTGTPSKPHAFSNSNYDILLRISWELHSGFISGSQQDLGLSPRRVVYGQSKISRVLNWFTTESAIILASLTGEYMGPKAP
jgi:hypothetical protein